MKDTYIHTYMHSFFKECLNSLSAGFNLREGANVFQSSTVLEWKMKMEVKME